MSEPLQPEPRRKRWVSFSTEKDFLEIALLAAALLTMGAICFGVVRMVVFFDRMEPKIIVTTENLDGTIIIIGATMGNIEKATRSIKAREDAEYAQIQEVSSQLTSIASNADTSVLALNSTLDSLNTLVKDSDLRMGMLTADADTDIKALPPVLVNFNTDLVSLNGVLLSAKKGLDELPLTMQLLSADLQKLGPVIDNVGTITKNLGHTTGTLDELVTWAYKKITAPVSRISAAAHVLARYGVEWLAYHF